MTKNKVLLLIVLTLVVAWPAFGQPTKSEKMFVPTEHLLSFQKAIGEFAACYEKHDWNCIYDMSFKPRVDKEEFLSKKNASNYFYDFSKLRKANLLLSGKYVDPVEGADASFSVHGCLQFEKGKPNLAVTQAYLVDGKWYFGGFMPWSFPRGVKDHPCKMDDYTRESESARSLQ